LIKRRFRLAFSSLSGAPPVKLSIAFAARSARAARCRSVEPFLNEKGTINLPEVLYWDDDTHSSAEAALANAIAAAAEALIKAQPRDGGAA
jgi:hypothetical protein